MDMTIEKRIENVCKTIMDPEIPYNIWDIGLIYSIEVEERTKIDGDAREVLDEGKTFDDNGETFMHAELKMTLTSPACPVGPEFLNNVKTRVQEVKGIDRCTVDLVWDPPWDQSMMSEEAQTMMGMELNRPMLDGESDDEGKYWQ